MLKLETILEKLNDSDFREIFIKADEDFDFDSRNDCYLLNEGDMLAYGEKNFTHKLRNSDPIRVAESIYGKTNILGYRRIRDKLNSWGIKTERGNKWLNTSVYSVLERKHQRDIRIKQVRNKKFPTKIFKMKVI